MSEQYEGSNPLARRRTREAAEATAASLAKRDWLKKRKLIQIANAHLGGDDTPVITVGINGTMFELPRGRVLDVPEAVAENLLGKKVDQWAMPAQRQLQGLVYIGSVDRFPVYEVPAVPKGQKAYVVNPRPPLSAVARAQLGSAAIAVEQESRAAAASVVIDKKVETEL